MFLQAGSPAELRAYMAQYPDSRCIAGGTDIMPVQNRENDHEAVFIDISGAAATPQRTACCPSGQRRPSPR